MSKPGTSAEKNYSKILSALEVDGIPRIIKVRKATF